MTKEEKREYAKQWRAKNQDKIKAYRIENKARDLKYQHKYRDSLDSLLYAKRELYRHN